MTAPRPGDMFVVRTGGWVAAAIRLLTRSSVNHAGIYMTKGIGEAQPGGYRISSDHYPNAIHVPMPFNDLQRGWARVMADELVGTPYNFLDIAALAISLTIGRRTPRFIERRLSRPDRLICSQACDLIAQRVGVQLFDDGRMNGEVTPGDLLKLAEAAR